MVMYNLTNLTSSLTVGDLVGAANEFTNGLLISSLLLAVFFILLMALRRYGFVEALMASGWIAFLLTMPLVLGKYVSLMWALGFLAIGAFATLYSALANH